MTKVYLLHFKKKLHHAGHYLGSTDYLEVRLKEHQSGHGAKLPKAVVEAGISWDLARVWEGDRFLERQLKRQKNAPRLCPFCNPKQTQWRESAPVVKPPVTVSPRPLHAQFAHVSIV